MKWEGYQFACPSVKKTISFASARCVEQLEKGEIGYTYPWAVSDSMIDPDAPIFPQAAGRATMKVKRTAEGFAVWK